MAEPPKFARLTRVRELTPSVRELHLAMVEPKTLEFRAGQTIVLYAGFRDGKEVKRQYTLASAPSEPELALCVKLIPGGPASDYLAGLKVGDQLTLSGPAGKCTLPEEVLGDLLFCITGNGLAPVRGMLLSHFEKEKGRRQGFFQKLFGGGRRVRLLWGLRTEADIFWKEELLEELRRQHPAFQYQITLSEPGPTWAGLRGRLTEHLPRQLKGLRRPHVFLIGNGAMIKEARRILEEGGVPKDSIGSEAFFTPKAQGGR
jgi:phenol/toluene 2-monooxygenase (NADH) P5/A5